MVLQQQMALSTSTSNPASMNSGIGGEAGSLTLHNNETSNTLSMSKSPVTDNKVYLVFTYICIDRLTLVIVDFEQPYYSSCHFISTKTFINKTYLTFLVM